MWIWLYCVVMEMIGALIVMHALEKKNRNFKIQRAGLCLVVYAAYYLVMTLCQLPQVVSALGYVILFVYIKWNYREKVLRSLAVLVISLIVVSIAEMLSMQIIELFYPIQSKPGLFEIMGATVAFLICAIFLLFPFYRLASMFGSWEISYLLVALLSLMIFLPVVTVRILKEVHFSEYMYIVVCVAVMWVLVFKIQKTRVENKLRQKYVEGYTDVISQIRRRQHKIKNQFNTAFGMYQIYDNYEDLVKNQKEFFGRFWNYELPTDAVILEEPGIVALVYEKINEALEANIQVETSFSCSMSGGKVSDIVWVQILGTLLDNAIEALVKYEGEKRLWIKVESFEKKIRVIVANSYRKLQQSEIERFFELGYSTKGENRGIGLYDVRELVYKYKGDLIAESTTCDGAECFQIQIIL